MAKKGPVYLTPVEKGRALKRLSNNIRKVHTKILDYIEQARDIKGYTRAAFTQEDTGMAALQKASEFCMNAINCFEEASASYNADGGAEGGMDFYV